MVAICENPILRHIASGNTVGFLTIEKRVDSLNGVFFDYLSEENVNTDERNEVLRDLILLLKEKYEVQSNKNCILHNDTSMFEYYCRLKYFKLYTHITRMIDKLENSIKEKRYNEF